MKEFIIFLFLFIIVGCKSDSKKNINKKQEIKTVPKVTIDVHPGVELLTIVQKIAGKFPESTPSKYKEHNAVKVLQEINKRIYPDFTELGFCFFRFSKL